MTQHTKGTWKTWTTDAPHAPVIIYIGDIPPKLVKQKGGKHLPVCVPGTFIAEVSSSHMHLNEREDIVRHDNARLIAAAPDLLEALKKFVSSRENKRTRNGLSACMSDPLNPCWNNRPDDKIGKHWGQEADDARNGACAYCHAKAAIAKATGGAS